MTQKDKLRIADKIAFLERGSNIDEHYYTFRSGVIAGINHMLEKEANEQRSKKEPVLTKEEYSKHGGKL